MTASVLDSVRGLGETRRNALVGHFGSVAKLKEATIDEITAVPGVGVSTARAVLEALSGSDQGAESGADNGAEQNGLGDDEGRLRRGGPATTERPDTEDLDSIDPHTRTQLTGQSDE